MKSILMLILLLASSSAWAASGDVTPTTKAFVNYSGSGGKIKATTFIDTLKFTGNVTANPATKTINIPTYTLPITDSVSTTSSTTAASATAVKAANDNANGRLASGGTAAAVSGNVNGAAIPVSKTIVGTNSSGQIVDATSATLSNNTSGTAGGLSGSPNITVNAVTATSATFSNNQAISINDSGGTARRSILQSSANDYYFGDIDHSTAASIRLPSGGGLEFRNRASNTAVATISDSGAITSTAITSTNNTYSGTGNNTSLSIAGSWASVPVTTTNALLIFRDNTGGGMAVFAADAAAGAVTLVNNITGFSVQWSAGWKMRITSGTTPRNISVVSITP